MSYVRANEIRSTGPMHDAWPSDLPFVYYVSADGGCLCVTCANGGNGSRAADKDLDPLCPDDHRWRVIGAAANKWNEPIQCGHCGRAIPPFGLSSDAPKTDPDLTNGTIAREDVKIGEWHDLSTRGTYRAAYVHDCVLTGPEHADLSDDDLLDVAWREATRAGIARRS